MARQFNSEDEGKKVMTAHGDMVGTIEKVSGGEAHVNPDTGLAQAIRQKLGWTSDDEDTYRLQNQNVDEISDDEVHLKSDL